MNLNNFITIGSILGLMDTKEYLTILSNDGKILFDNTAELLSDRYNLIDNVPGNLHNKYIKCISIGDMNQILLYID